MKLMSTTNHIGRFAVSLFGRVIPFLRRKKDLVRISGDDRGPTPFFHGREREISSFDTVLDDARAKVGGSIFMVQGAPGAGKTALLHECAKRAAARQWHVVEIAPSALHDPKELADCLAQPYVAKTVRQSQGSASIGVAILGGRYSKGDSIELTGLSVKQMIRQAAKRRGLVLILDEAQILAKGGQIRTVEDAAIAENLAQIHNGGFGAPVVLLAGGLGILQRVFSSFGITRFRSDSVHNLGPVSLPTGQAIARDWLVRAGGVFDGDPLLPHWTNTLAMKSQGWPQHLHNYILAAVTWIRENNGELQPQVPHNVLAEARKNRESYYGGRTSELDEVAIEVFANYLATLGPDQSLKKASVVAALRAHMPDSKAEVVFDDLLQKGVLARRPHPQTGYNVPIPSMHRWLVKQYTTDRS